MIENIVQDSPNQPNKQSQDKLNKQQPNQESKIDDSEINQQQITAKSNYLSKLLGKHMQQATLAQSFTEDKYRYFQDEILNGKYEIKNKIWSAQEQKQKQLKAANLKSSSKIFQSKKHLLEQLQQIQNKINQNEEQKGHKQLSQEQRIAFIKKIDKERKQFLKKKQQLLKKAQQQRLQQAKRLAQQSQKAQGQKRLKRKQQLEEKIKIQEELRKKKEQQFKNQQLLLKQKMKQKTMVQKMEQQYNAKQNQSLQERKKHLAQIRALHKPIDRKELDAHAEKLQQLHTQRLAAIAASAQNQQERSAKTVFYKSVFYKKIQQQQKIFVDKKNQDEISKLREARDRLKKFSEQVRQNHKPTIDEKKKQELMLRNSNLKNRSMSSNIQRAKDPQQGKKLGLRYLQFSKMQIDQKLLGASDNKNQQSGQKEAKKLDYLAELRQKNKNRKPQNAHSFIAKIQKLNISKQQKMKKILDFTDKIQKKAKMKELNDLTGHGLVDSELDRLYLQAIQAKLGLLQDY